MRTCSGSASTARRVTDAAADALRDGDPEDRPDRRRFDGEDTQVEHGSKAARAIGEPRRDRGLDPACDAGPASGRRALDESIRETIPGLRYAVKWKKAYYGLPELGWIIEMVSYDVSVNVVFFGGADFDPPPPLGTTNRSRYVKLTNLEEAQGPEIHKWIEKAGGVPGWT